jgi:hypothetical protein
MDVWRGEVERAWVGMTNESMTDLERARLDLETTLEEIRAGVAAIPWKRIAVLSAASMIALVALTVVVIRQLVQKSKK